MKTEYINFCNSNKNICTFYNPWWLDTVCGEKNWDVILYKDNNEIKSFYTFSSKTKYIFRLSTIPSLTLLNGPVILDKNTSLSKIHQINTFYIDILKQYAFVNINTCLELPSIMPYIWNGYNQSSRISYQIDLSQDHMTIFNNFSKNIKYDINKSKYKYSNRVTYNIDTREFYSLLCLSYLDKGMNYPYSYELIYKIIESARSNKSIITVGIINSIGKLLCGNIIINSHDRSYYLLGATLPSKKNQGVSSHCIWESVIASKEVSPIFDFEGSMVHGIEKYFRSFGSSPYIINNLIKINSKLLNLPYKILKC